MEIPWNFLRRKTKLEFVEFENFVEPAFDNAFNMINVEVVEEIVKFYVNISFIPLSQGIIA